VIFDCVAVGLGREVFAVLRGCSTVGLRTARPIANGATTHAEPGTKPTKARAMAASSSTSAPSPSCSQIGDRAVNFMLR
jgi:hypothetical protein